MKKTALLILAFGLSLSAAFAGTPVLDKMIAATDATGGLSITFSITMEGQKSIEGHYRALGKKFHFSTSRMKAWYDGTNLWVYLEENGEVNLSIPMKEDLALINPLLNLDEVKKADFEIRESELPRVGHRVTAVPKGKTSSLITRLTAECNPDFVPTLIKIEEKGMSPVRVQVLSIKKGPFPEMNQKDFFSFLPSKLPGKPVIDLR